jgi:hypothetical protein
MCSARFELTQVIFETKYAVCQQLSACGLDGIHAAAATLKRLRSRLRFLASKLAITLSAAAIIASCFRLSRDRAEASRCNRRCVSQYHLLSRYVAGLNSVLPFQQVRDAYLYVLMLNG